MDEDELQQRVNKASGASDEDERDTSNADNENLEDDDDLEADADNTASDDDSDDDQDDDENRKNDKPAKRTTGSDARGSDNADDDSEDDDDSVDYQRPNFGGSPVSVQPFDIRNLPRNEYGQIDPDQANQAANEHNAKVIEAQEAERKAVEENKKLLTNQWIRGVKKYPEIGNNRSLFELASEIQISSVTAAQSDPSKYLTPQQALAKVNKMYKKAVGKGVEQQKTKRTVENMGRTERPSGKGGEAPKMSSYEKAKKMAQSSDPVKAREGRKLVIRAQRKMRNSR